jgi:hypothetical protein
MDHRRLRGGHEAASMTPEIHLVDLLPHTRAEILVDSVAGATASVAISAPLWLPWLKEASEIAALALPILGVLLIAVQIVAKVYVTRRIMRGQDTGGLE